MLRALFRYTESIIHGDLFDAIKINDAKRVEILLTSGENPNNQSGNWTPLYYTLLYGALDCTILLLKHKANPNIHVPQWKNETPLHCAVNIKNTSFIRLLLFFGANRNEKNQLNQETTHPHISTDEINNFMENVCNQIIELENAIKQGNNFYLNKNYYAAIEYYTKAADIYRLQAKEESQNTHHNLYKGGEEINNSKLIQYFNDRALLCYQATENAYAKLAKQQILTEDEKKNYCQVLEKIIEFSKKTEQPIVQYLNTMAILSTNHKLLTMPEEQNINQTPMSIMVKVASSSSPLHHVNSGSDTLRKRKKIMLTSENGNHEEKKPLLSTS